MTDTVRLEELLGNVRNPELQSFFAEVDGLTEEQLDLVGSTIYGYNISANIAEKRLKIKHNRYLQVALLQALPEVLAENTVGHNLATVTAEWLTGLVENAEVAEIYSSIDKLPEELLDILAADFGVDWWNADFTVEQKRRTFKQVWYVFRHMGTTSAVRAAVGAVFDFAVLQEWTEYGGKPYHFRILVDTGGKTPDISAVEMAALEREVERYKNVRSVCDSLQFTVEKTVQEYIGIGWAEHDFSELSVGLPVSNELLTDENDILLTDENGQFLLS